MAAGVSVTKAKRSPAVAGYFYDLVYLTDVTDPTTRTVFPTGKNSVTLTGMEPEFTVEGIDMQVLTNAFGDDAAAAACYGTYDESSVVKYTSAANSQDPTICLVDLWLGGGSEGTGVSRVLLFAH